jgi:uncharacterized membrane protein
MIKDNIVYIGMILLIIGFWLVALRVRKTDKGDGKRKKIAGWMIFGGLWPLIDKDSNRNLTKIEIIGIAVVITFMIGALIHTNFSTNGTFVW